MTVHDDLLADLTSAKLIRSNSPTLSFVLFLQPLPLPPLPLLPPLSLLRSTRTPSVAPLPCFTLPTRSALSSLGSTLSSPSSPHPPPQSGLDLELVWQIVYLTILGFVTLIIPFAVFHYDAYDIDSKTAKMVGGGVKQCCRAIRWQFVSLVLATCFLIPMYVLLNKTSIPFTNIQVNVSQISAAGSVPVFGGAACKGGIVCVEEKRKLAMQVTFPVYVMAMMSWVGWFFFVLYAGIGLITFPYDMFMSFTRRPRYMPVQEVLRYKGEVRSDAEKIIGIGQQMQHEMEEKAVGGGGAKKRKMRKADRKTFNQFKQTVYALEMRYEDLKLVTGWEKSPSCGNTLAPWFNLLTGICCIIVSLAWLIHICLYMVPAVPVHPFLNDLLNTFSNIPELGSVFVGLFSFYLLICVVKGNFKFGMRFLLVSIHPMEYGNTLMSSFLVNISLILFACPAVVQFSVAAFKDYARLTDVEGAERYY